MRFWGVLQSAATAFRHHGMISALIRGTHMRFAIATIAAAVLALAVPADGEISGDVGMLGVLNDMSSIYADISGPGSVEAARMAIADFGGVVNGKKIELISADHQNKPDVGSAIANQWVDNEGVDAIVDVPTSSVALGVPAIRRTKGKEVRVL